ncbi:hypothetical protein J2782_002925 [Brucella pseudogrignonensis]|uniref:Uncharacterized protein n=1 Tax=Brucella pseudogrignonensis TaxID=419475 RepID=A0ABU1MAX7_9HYPH|nr:hypothetical protein [Brucella pseudogrignonensis]
MNTTSNTADVANIYFKDCSDERRYFYNYDDWGINYL